jgi:hypothetical protein
MPINRRWDPVVWKDANAFHMLCLAADYGLEANAKPWWMGDNAMELWTGASLDALSLESDWPRQGVIWTAPTVFRDGSGAYLCVTGTNAEGPCPEQHGMICNALTMEPLADLPEPPRQYRSLRGNASWRDGRIWVEGDEWWLTITTGGFRWGGPPTVLLYRSSRWDRGWYLDAPVIDPAIGFLFSELERPQLHRLADGRWLLWWSTWAHLRSGNPMATTHFAVSAGAEPVVSRYLGEWVLPYGLTIHDGIACGWEWTDRETRSANCKLWVAGDMIERIARFLETGHD